MRESLIRPLPTTACAPPWIAAAIGWGAGFVATVIDRLARRYPRVVCHLTVCDAPVTTLALERRDVDMVVERVVVPRAENHLRAEVLFSDSHSS
jgi:DNA-binding transcriptional LysR family regulator